MCCEISASSGAPQSLCFSSNETAVEKVDGDIREAAGAMDQSMYQSMCQSMCQSRTNAPTRERGG